MKQKDETMNRFNISYLQSLSGLSCLLLLGNIRVHIQSTVLAWWMYRGLNCFIAVWKVMNQSLACGHTYPARYLNLFRASVVEIIHWQVKVSLYMRVLSLHHSWLQATELKCCFTGEKDWHRKKENIFSLADNKAEYKHHHCTIHFSDLQRDCLLQRTLWTSCLVSRGRRI